MQLWKKACSIQWDGVGVGWLGDFIDKREFISLFTSLSLPAVVLLGPAISLMQVEGEKLSRKAVRKRGRIQQALLPLNPSIPSCSLHALLLRPILSLLLHWLKCSGSLQEIQQRTHEGFRLPANMLLSIVPEGTLWRSFNSSVQQNALSVASRPC